MTTSSLPVSRSMLIGEHLRRSAHRTPDKEAYIYGEKRLTYRQMEERAVHLAGWLQGKGIDYDDKAGFMLFNGLPFIEIFYSVLFAGAVGVPINFRLNSDELHYIITNSDCKILFIEQKLLPLFEPIRNRCPLVQEIVVIDGEEGTKFENYESLYNQEANFVPCEHLNGDDGALIMYTSGTSGLPKGAGLTHHNLSINGMNQVMTAGLNADFKQLIVAPLFHIAAISTLLYPIQGKTVIHQQFNPKQVLKTIEKERITFLFLAPTMWQMLVDHEHIDNYNLTSMTRCSAGSAPCSVALKEKVARYFPNGEFRDPFGQTEMSPVATCLNPEDSIRKNMSVGKPVVNVEVRVVDEQMNDVPLGEIGEIVYRGPMLMKEYYKNPEATEEAFRGGWSHSGDLVRMDDEGFIYVVDRKKDMIISGGENIYPAEIEQALMKHPAIKECAVIGIPDDKWGESVKAVIVKRSGAELTEGEVVQFCQNQLASYKKPKVVEFIDALPRNAAGKILKKALRQADAPMKS